MNSLLIGAMGALGVLLRFWVDNDLTKRFLWSSYLNILLINSLGSLAIGFIYTMNFQRNILSQELLTAIAIGLLGGFTTFSTLSFQTFQLLQEKQILPALALLFGSPAIGLLSCTAGFFMAKVFLGR